MFCVFPLILRERLSNVILLVGKVALLVTANVSLVAGFRLDELSFCHRGAPPTEANGG
jgi:hypothetical protein